MESVRQQKSLNGVANIDQKIPEDILLAMFKGEMDLRAVFMSGKASADFGDLMKMGMAFDEKIAKQPD